MKIAIGTLNKAKIKAVENVIRELWKDSEFFTVNADSGISNQPMSDEEAIKGAVNRANYARTCYDSDYGIGLEGCVDENPHGMFLCGWTVVVDRYGKTGIGSSGRILLPEKIRYRLKSGEELGPIMDELFCGYDRHSTGAGGILTKNLCTRTGEFEEATRCALAIFVSPKFYEK